MLTLLRSSICLRDLPLLSSLVSKTLFCEARNARSSLYSVASTQTVVSPKSLKCPTWIARNGKPCMEAASHEAQARASGPYKQSLKPETTTKGSQMTSVIERMRRRRRWTGPITGQVVGYDRGSRNRTRRAEEGQEASAEQGRSPPSPTTSLSSQTTLNREGGESFFHLCRRTA